MEDENCRPSLFCLSHYKCNYLCSLIAASPVRVILQEAERTACLSKGVRNVPVSPSVPSGPVLVKFKQSMCSSKGRASLGESCSYSLQKKDVMKCPCKVQNFLGKNLILLAFQSSYPDDEEKNSL